MRIVLLGAPGVGKGTAASRLSAKYGIPAISTGDILKEQIRNKTPLGLEVQKVVESGHLVSDELVNKVMKDRLERGDVKKGVILDGYPRTVEQAKSMDKFAHPDIALNFFADRNKIIERLSGRRVCTVCGKIFHIKFNPPKTRDVCDSCNGKLIKRKDDDESVIAKRLDVYEVQTKPLIQFYDKRNQLAQIDANYPMEQIDKIVKQCENALVKVNKNG